MKIYPFALTALLFVPGQVRAQDFTGENLVANLSTQHVLVIVEEQNASIGQMFQFSFDGSHWQQIGKSTNVSVGAKGVGKTREGDKRAPTGAYPLLSVFGYDSSPPPWLKMQYLPSRVETECVDDHDSVYYNRIVNPSELSTGKDWRSSEKMRRDVHNGDHMYKYGVFVGYNQAGGRSVSKGIGSCIFLHIWRGPGKPTAGCTALSEPSMMNLIRWLDPAASPLLIQGTRQDIMKLFEKGILPYSPPAIPPQNKNGP